MSRALLQRLLIGGTLIATITVAAGATGGSSATFSVDTNQICKSQATCTTIEQEGPGQALLAEAVSNNGSVGTTHNPSNSNGRRFSGVWGEDISNDGGFLNVGVSGSSTNGAGMLATSSNYAGLIVKGGNTGSSQRIGRRPAINGIVPALAVTGGSHASAPLIDGCKSGGPTPCTDNVAVFKVANNGAITVAGCTGCGTAPTMTVTGRRVDAYTPRATVPTIEDVGEGRVSAGRGYVRIDPAFADTTDRSNSYLVMITPEGPSRGLYVAERSPSGFQVRENPGGTSTLAFTYRIVAKPFDTAPQRLPSANGG